MATLMQRTGVPGLADGSLLLERAFVAGAWQAAADGAELTVVNPASGETIGTVPDCGGADADAAIAAAAAAFPAWRARTAASRCAILEEWHRLTLDNAGDLARIMTAEQGKPLAEAKGEIAYAASFVK